MTSNSFFVSLLVALFVALLYRTSSDSRRPGQGERIKVFAVTFITCLGAMYMFGDAPACDQSAPAPFVREIMADAPDARGPSVGGGLTEDVLSNVMYGEPAF